MERCNGSLNKYFPIFPWIGRYRRLYLPNSLRDDSSLSPLYLKTHLSSSGQFNNSLIKIFLNLVRCPRPSKSFSGLSTLQISDTSSRACILPNISPGNTVSWSMNRRASFCSRAMVDGNFLTELTRKSRVSKFCSFLISSGSYVIPSLWILKYLSW